MRYSFSFGPFRLDPRERLLLRGNEIVPLAPKVFDILLTLVQQGGALLGKDELLRRVWPDAIVEESNLTQYVYALRKILGDRPDGHPYIETIPRRGYRFAVPVGEVPVRDSPLPLRSLAVLPFRCLGAESKDDLGVVLANALITKFSRLEAISVRPTSAILKYTNHEVDLFAAGRELDVDGVLEGTIERSADQIRVTVQLVVVRDATPLWAEKFDEPLTSVFAVSDSVSEQVMQRLKPKFEGVKDERPAGPHSEPQAHQAYRKGRYFWEKRTEEGMQKAISYFEQAIALDPGYALAFSGLADAYFLLGVYRALPPKDSFPKARKAAEKALTLDDTLAEPHCSLAYIRACFDWDWEGAERGFRRALTLNPSYTTGHIWYSDYLSAVGRFGEAISEVNLALELDPVSVINNLNLALSHYFARRYDRAVEDLLKALELDPYSALGRWLLGQAYRQQGRYAEALGELLQSTNLSGRSPFIVATLGQTYAVSGQAEEARKILQELKKLSRQRYVSPYEIATIYAGLGENGPALKWLGQAVEERSGRLLFLKVDPCWDSLRPDPLFSALFRRIGLEP